MAYFVFLLCLWGSLHILAAWSNFQMSLGVGETEWTQRFDDVNFILALLWTFGVDHVNSVWQVKNLHVCMHAFTYMYIIMWVHTLCPSCICMYFNTYVSIFNFTFIIIILVVVLGESCFYIVMFSLFFFVGGGVVLYFLCSFMMHIFFNFKSKNARCLKKEECFCLKQTKQCAHLPQNCLWRTTQTGGYFTPKSMKNVIELMVEFATVHSSLKL